MKIEKFGIHEVVDLRELINFKAACLVQSKNRLEKVENLELKELVDQSVLQGNRTVRQMKELLTSASTQMNQ
ncbi:hypothetical protein [Halobacillus seohaensis]|uniref:Spore coat protein n=1 Tax=Halobacillus seohaensis TaxID=447421 RepID=A0ABW2EKG1_9BACI